MKPLAMTRMAACGLALLLAGEAAAQNRPNCAPRQVVVDRLTEKYGETRQSIGLGSQGTVMELFASTETGTWTITITTPGGVTCLVGAGDAYETQALAEPAGIRL
ncbi:MAG: hypothetical protein OIF47_09565 [Marinibacterium sp.]|nr:hypothetical protein [Marinibacterium sp.]